MFARILASALLATVTVAHAQDYPSRPPVIVVPFAAGGPNDIIGRETADVMSSKLGKQFVVENRAGGGGVAGMRYVMSAKPDGYTLFAGSPGPLVISPLASAGNIDVDGQLAPIGVVSESPQVLVVSAALPVKTVAELAALAKAKPGSLNYGSAGAGTTPHLSAELFRQLAGIDIQHVPYRGTSAAIPDILRGDLNLIFGDVATLKPFIESGAVRALCVTGTTRSALLPDVPSAAEAGYPKLVVRNFSILFAPAGTPASVIDTLAKALDASKQDEGFKTKMARQGMGMLPSSPAHVRDYLKAERETWGPLVKSLNLEVAP